MTSSKGTTIALRAVGAALAAAGALIWAFGSVAVAAPGDSGDPRATAFPGNATSCADAGLAGQILISSDDSSGGSNQFITVVSDGTFLDVTVSPEVTVTGVVVKGGPNYNVYPGGLFVDGSENGLHAPLVGNDNIPTISHWFICGTTTTTTTTPSTTTSTTSTTPSTTTRSTTPSTTTSTTTTGTSTTRPSTTPAMTTTSSSGGGLPNTGAPTSALALVAFGLLVSGAGLLLVPGLLSTSRKH